MEVRITKADSKNKVDSAKVNQTNKQYIVRRRILAYHNYGRQTQVCAQIASNIKKIKIMIDSISKRTIQSH